MSAAEIEAIEAAHPGGVSTRQVVELFQSRGERFSEATFRKYVQLGLLPRSSRRVGRKGKFKGSVGLYPVAVVRRVALIKKMMAEGLTLEDIQQSFVALKNDIDSLQSLIDELFETLQQHLGRQPPGDPRAERLCEEVNETRARAEALMRHLERVASAVAARPPLVGPPLARAP